MESVDPQVRSQLGCSVLFQSSSFMARGTRTPDGLSQSWGGISTWLDWERRPHPVLSALSRHPSCSRLLAPSSSSSSSPYMYLLMRRNATAAAAQSRRAQTQTHFRRPSHLSPVVVWRKIAIQLQHVLGLLTSHLPPPRLFFTCQARRNETGKTSSLKGGQRRNLHDRTWHSLTAALFTALDADTTEVL